MLNYIFFIFSKFLKVKIVIFSKIPTFDKLTCSG